MGMQEQQKIEGERERSPKQEYPRRSDPIEAAEGMMKRMQLSEAEKKGFKIGGGGPPRAKPSGPQGVSKVLAEKSASAEGLAHALGKIWCPIKGVGQEAHLGWDDGPWMFGKDFVVMVEYDETKVLEEMEFFSILIWPRAMKMPLGEMNKVTGVAIGREDGEFLEMEVEDDGTIVEQFLRIKGTLTRCVTSSLRRTRFSNIVGVCGLSRRRGDGKRDEVIGLLVEELLGHDVLVELEVQAVGEEEVGDDQEATPLLGGGRRGECMAKPQKVARDEKEVTSPLNLTASPKGGSSAKRALFRVEKGVGKEKEKEVEEAREVAQSTDMEVLEGGNEKGAGKEKRKKVGTYKKVSRASVGNAAASAKSARRKMGGDDDREVRQKEGEKVEGR
ncbi:hypothetical protein C2845_PM10G11400 [Panicum miliaceum]|uniref:DUF4283 domain-containing protein n=1 Tax=Panicum miliaceum TaxID=4540 RepID=A0A3L6PAN0_PANMI|nr:hypothetical protein C2845_PM10G11400 [Panicum miliaceum]